MLYNACLILLAASVPCGATLFTHTITDLFDRGDRTVMNSQSTPGQEYVDDSQSQFAQQFSPTFWRIQASASALAQYSLLRARAEVRGICQPFTAPPGSCPDNQAVAGAAAHYIDVLKVEGASGGILELMWLGSQGAYQFVSSKSYAIVGALHHLSLNVGGEVYDFAGTTETFFPGTETIKANFPFGFDNEAKQFRGNPAKFGLILRIPFSGASNIHLLHEISLGAQCGAILNGECESRMDAWHTSALGGFRILDPTGTYEIEGASISSQSGHDYTQVIPEPGTFLLLLVGLFVFLVAHNGRFMVNQNFS